MNDNQILEKINRATLRFLEPLTLEELYKIIVEEAIRLVDGLYGSLVLYQDNEFNRVYTTLPDEISRNFTFRKKGLTYKAFINREAFVVETEGIRKLEKVVKIGVQSNIYIPLSYKGTSLGVLIVNSTEDRKFSKSELDVLKVFGSMATLAIRKNQSYEETKQALETRDLFISLAAHELRTPLTSVSGYAQLIKSRLASSPNTTEARWAEELVGECRRLTTIANELLTINQIKSGHLQFVFVEGNIKEMVDRAISNIKFSHPNRVVVVNDKIQPGQEQVICDQDKLQQVITNVLENAIKFSPSVSEVKVNLISRMHDLIIQIIDTGKGIDPKDMPKVFDNYYRASKNANDVGMGLGLFLSKYIIKSHQGTINITSKVNKGTKVEIRLPRVRI